MIHCKIIEICVSLAKQCTLKEPTKYKISYSNRELLKECVFQSQLKVTYQKKTYYRHFMLHEATTEISIVGDNDAFWR